LRRLHAAPLATREREPCLEQAGDGVSGLILSLCDFTGEWPRPYAEAGYRVHGEDVRLLHKPAEPVIGILAAPPCTVFASSGARWPRSDDDYREALAIVDACLRLVTVCRPRFWALENPVGKLVRWLGKPRLYFNPCDYGDPWTKRTCLWGEFNDPVPNPVAPDPRGYPGWYGLGGKSERTKTLRSTTPAGFARQFFLANNPLGLSAERAA
jgi:hypothetical protein